MKKWYLIFFIILIMITFGGCVQDKPFQEIETRHAVERPEPANITELQAGTQIEKISSELKSLKINGWNRLSGKLGRPRTTAVLWYHLKTVHGIDTKIVFGNPDKLNSAVAILASKGGNSSLPKIMIKNNEYYIINPTIPEIMSEFKYGELFDDPGGRENYLSNSFRLDQKDINEIDIWMQGTGMVIRYSDFNI